MESVLHQINADCKTNNLIKDDHPCLLRHGVENSKIQSFIACISDELFYGKNDNTLILSIKQMRERIIEAIQIDSFIQYQNGNLVINFNDPKRQIDINKYDKSILFSKIDKNNPDQMAYLNKAVSAFENFVSFLRDDNAVIDHTYLWDIICMPNALLFPTGVNLVIFYLPNVKSFESCSMPERVSLTLSKESRESEKEFDSSLSVLAKSIVACSPLALK